MERSIEVRRILAVYLPEFLCELALGLRQWSLDKPDKTPAPMGVILAERAEDVRPQDKLAAVCARAFCRGVRPGQTPAEASVASIKMRSTRAWPYLPSPASSSAVSLLTRPFW